MYRWPWLEDKIRHRPWIGLVVLLGLVAVCVWILVTAPGDRSPRSGLPLWPIAVGGIVLFGCVGVRYVQVMRRRRFASGPGDAQSTPGGAKNSSAIPSGSRNETPEP